jgi:hypothetical protein
LEYLIIFNCSLTFFDQFNFIFINFKINFENAHTL